MIRFKKQFLFLFSFPFKIPAILSQQEVSNVNVSQQSFSTFSFFFFCCILRVYKYTNISGNIVNNNDELQ